MFEVLFLYLCLNSIEVDFKIYDYLCQRELREDFDRKIIVRLLKINNELSRNLLQTLFITNCSDKLKI